MAIRRTLDLAELFSTYEDADIDRSLLEVSYEYKEDNYQSFCIGTRQLLDLYFESYGSSTSSIVSFNGNGGFGEMLPLSVELNQQVIVPECQFTYDKHYFTSWLVQIGFKSYYFQPNEILVVPNQDIELVAQWQDLPKFNVYFKDNYNNILAETQHVVSGECARQPLDPQIPGYDFTPSSWSLDGQPYDFNSPVTQQLTIYGKTTPKQFTVSFNPNGGSVSPNQKMVTFGQEYGTLPTPTIQSGASNIQYSFNSWQNDQVLGKIVTSTTIVAVAEDHVLTAVWEPASIRIDVYPNGGNGNPQQVNLKSGDKFTPSDYGFSKDNYRLLGFSKNGEATDPDYPIGESKTVYNSLQLYAVWKYEPKDIIAAINVTSSGGKKLDCVVTDPQSGAVVYYSVNKGAWQLGSSYTAASSCSVYFKVEANGYNTLGDDYTFGKKLVRTKSKTDQVGPYRFDSKTNAAKYATALQAQGYIVSTSSSGSGAYFVSGYKLNVSWTVSDI